MSKYEILPFCKVQDDLYTVPDIILKELWQRLCKEEKATTVFYCGHIKNEDDWLRFIKRPDHYFVFIVNTENKQIVLVAWLNWMNKSRALSHFFVLGTYQRAMGRLLIQYWKIMTKATPLVLMGYIPESNLRALKFAKSIGYKVVGTIPNYCYLVYENRHVPAVVLFFDTRNNGR